MDNCPSAAIAPAKVARSQRVKEDWLCCQTNANSSQCLQRDQPLGGAKLPPLGESGGSVSFEVIALGEAAILVEVV